ncbi:ABC transporter permease [Microbacterium sp. Marseille-Q6965]|uniref:ABC transporter permease n=1 Tax=Microbacterium sp. Marseille-Q6965 TaxID=2965072 RepID=UPI0021B7F946|nr:ABC transporter permease [Microbacterium sp. Marseille-Q6965]
MTTTGIAVARVGFWPRLQHGLLRVPGIRTWGPFAVVAALWAAIAAAQVFPDAFFTGPATVWDTTVELVRKGILPSYIADSAARLAIGALYGLAIGIPLGFLVGLNRYVRRFTWPVLLFFQAIGDIAWLPILIIWFGFSLTSVTIVIVYTVVFPLIISIVAAIDGIPQNLLRASGSLGAGRWQRVLYVVLPGALPGVSSGIRTGLGYGLRALIAAEIIIGTSGVGFMMFDARRQGEISQVFVGMIVLGILWYLLDALVLAPFEKQTVERWGMVEGVGR